MTPIAALLGVGVLALLGRGSTSSTSSSSSTSKPRTAWEDVPVADDSSEADSQARRIASSSETPWIPIALQEFGQAERTGSENPRIVEYHRSVDSSVSTDEVPWCASFVGWVLTKAGHAGTRSRLARSYLSWGRSTPPRFGAVVVLSRGSSSTQGHVGFLVASSDDHSTIYVLGGNQGDRVSVAPFAASSVLGYRWPEVSA